MTCNVADQGPTLWPHQVQALEALHQHIHNRGRRGVVVMPTGTGKTVLFLTLARDLGLKTLVLVHRDELVRQTTRAARRVWPDCLRGVIKGERDEWGEGQDVVTASVQSLHRKSLERMPRDRFGLVVVDEAHHAPAPTYLAVLDHFRADFVLGVTATPQRLDGKGLSDIFGDTPVFCYQLRTAVEDQMLAPPRQFAVRTDVDLDRVKTRAGDFAEDQLARTVNTATRNKAVVDAFLKHGQGRRAVAFAVNLEHVDSLARAFEVGGFITATVTGKDDEDDRRRVIRQFARGEFQVLVNCMVCTEGWDDPGVNCVVMSRPTKSKSLYQQMVGRGLRLYEGKEDCLILDVTDNCKKHKLVTMMSLFGRENLGLGDDAEGRDVVQMVREAEAEQEALMPITWRLEEVSPWWPEGEGPTLDGYAPDSDWQDEPATERQVGYLEGVGFVMDEGITKGEAAHIIDQLKKLEADFPPPATPKQRGFLIWQGRWREGMTKAEAHRLIGMIKGG
jgi:superfamily II DNA or RNA helicase